MSAPRPAAAGRPPRGSRKVAKPHFLKAATIGHAKGRLMLGAAAGRPHGHPGWKVTGVSDDGSLLTLRDCSKAGFRAQRLAYGAGRPSQFFAGQASERPGRGRGAVQGGAREHTARHRASVAKSPRWPPRLAPPAPPDPTAPARCSRVLTSPRRDRGCAAGFAPARQALPDVFWLPADHRCCRQVGAGGSGRAWHARRGAGAFRWHWPVACVRVPRPERRHGRGLATTQLEPGGL